MAIAATDTLTIRLGSDLKFPIAGNFQPISGLDLLLQDIQLLLLTVPGERVMNPTYGCLLKNQVWENSDDVVSTGVVHIKSAINQFEPRITLTNVTADLNRNTDLITFVISFIVNATNTPVNLVFPFRTASQLTNG